MIRVIFNTGLVVEYPEATRWIDGLISDEQDRSYARIGKYVDCIIDFGRGNPTLREPLDCTSTALKAREEK